MDAKLIGLALTAAIYMSPAIAAGSADKPSVERGRYIARVAGCNDCHTPNYPMSGGNVPEKDWLVGDNVGWKGGFGTTYPANLRTLIAGMTEDQWVKYARTMQARPPMPWFALRHMTEVDLRSFHRFVRSLGPAGEAAPAYLPPGQTPKGPFYTFPEPPAAAQKTAAK
ncbi:MAG TPA: cytochrome C [Usitatibacter sp.]|nr:cytochrome C [Usitatibacter sp.]